MPKFSAYLYLGPDALWMRIFADRRFGRSRLAYGVENVNLSYFGQFFLGTNPLEDLIHYGGTEKSNAESLGCPSHDICSRLT